jgi:hypothetical protein
LQEFTDIGKDRVAVPLHDVIPVHADERVVLLLGVPVVAVCIECRLDEIPFPRANREIIQIDNRRLALAIVQNVPDVRIPVNDALRQREVKPRVLSGAVRACSRAINVGYFRDRGIFVRAEGFSERDGMPRDDKRLVYGGGTNRRITRRFEPSRNGHRLIRRRRIGIRARNAHDNRRVKFVDRVRADAQQARALRAQSRRCASFR